MGFRGVRISPVPRFEGEEGHWLGNIVLVLWIDMIDMIYPGNV